MGAERGARWAGGEFIMYNPSSKSANEERAMPLVEVRRFRIRGYECDKYGRVNQANYVRYMQEAAFDASAAAGYDFNRYEEMGCHWLIRETDIEFYSPLRYGDSVEVKTWIGDFRRVRSRRLYELKKAASEEMVARAHTDWVFLDTTTYQPTSIPTEMMMAFFPEGPPEQGLRRTRFTQPPRPSRGVFSMRRKPEWRDIDPEQHVNNAVYLYYLDRCDLGAAAEKGWPVERMEEGGFSLAARRCWIEYKQPAVLGDELEITTWISERMGDTATRHYTISRVSDGTLLVRALKVWGAVGLETGQPIPIPVDFLEDIASD
jgi:acyl-CoA thioester hydrolase